MYDFLDRPVSGLAADDRLTLDAIRTWALAATLGRDPLAALAARLPLPADALTAVDGAMAALDTGTSEPMVIERPCAERIADGEAMLLAVARLARRGEVAAAADSLALVTEAAAAARAAALLAEAGRLLTH